ncbi:MAG: penicillin acylase family protein [Pseudomonadota bacterium]
MKLTPLLSVSILAGLYAGAATAQDNITGPSLSAPVTVQIDALGIPTMTGESFTDVAFAQGYLHAADRFFQMDTTRRAISGTASELFGPSQLASDIQLRTLGLRRAAQATWSALDAETQAALNSFSDGVNAWLAANPLPPEYAALELTSAETWTPIDSIVVAKGLAFQLSFDLDIDLTITALAYQQVGEIGGFDGNALFAVDTHRVAPIDGRVTVPDFISDIGGVGSPTFTHSLGGSSRKVRDTPATYLKPERIARIPARTALLAEQYREKIIDIPLLAKTLEPRDGRGGSNEWAVAGAFTADGMPLVANDPHLALDMAPVFTEGHLIIEGENGYSVSGVAVPGAPGIIQGCNDKLCWGTTVNPMDVTDVFEETLVVNSLGLPTHTVFNGQLEPVKWIFQSYYVNNVGDGEPDNITRANVPYDGGTVTVIVPRRNNGPLLEIDGTFGLSVQYIGFGATKELQSFRRINAARGLDDFKAALQDFDVGSQNFIYGDVDGNIAYFTSGEMPLRADLQNDMMPDGGIPPYLIRTGNGALNHEWLLNDGPQPGQTTPYQILPFEEMPQAENPESGYLANANNDPVGTTLDNNALNQVRPGGGIYYLNPGYSAERQGRIDRIMEDLIARGDITLDDMAVLQSNNQLLDAELLTPFLLEAVQNASADGAWPGIAQFLLDPRITEAAARLSGWDFSTPTGIAEGYDPFDDPANLPEPDQAEIDASVAATIYSVWRGQAVRNSIDATLSAIGLGSFTPGSRQALSAFHYHLDAFDTNGGVGASGIPFFNVPPDLPQPPTAADARDFVLLASLQGALDLLASDEFAPAFGNSQNLADYRWGKLHRIVFNHPLGVDPFNVPNGGGLSDVSPELPGVARSGGWQVVDASSHSVRADGLNEFMFGSGPARRFIGTLTPDGPMGEEVIPGGRSGVFLSPHYADQLPLWLTNDYHPLTLGADAADMTEVSRFQFVPSNP